jgi:hypothetical protein
MAIIATTLAGWPLVPLAAVMRIGMRIGIRIGVTTHFHILGMRMQDHASLAPRATALELFQTTAQRVANRSSPLLHLCGVSSMVLQITLKSQNDLKLHER